MTLDCHSDHCITCSDEGVPMTVLRTDEDRGLALCENADGAKESVEITLVEPVEPGDALLVHAGVALTRLDNATADRGPRTADLSGAKPR
jgi:hydrogenase expression/formation protein HypC